MWELLFGDNTSDDIYYSIEHFLHEEENVKNLGITKTQLLHLHKILDVKKKYKTFNALHKKFNNKMKISKAKLKQAIFLLLAYTDDIIVFI